MNVINDLKYTNDHEWLRIEGQSGIVGLTDYAQEHLGDIVYVELPEEGVEVAQGDSFGVVESVKTVSDLLAPVSGVVTEINSPVVEDPAIINQDPYDEGWLLKITYSNMKEIDSLLSAEQYQKYIQEEEE